MALIDAISEMNMDQLNKLVESGIWKSNMDIWTMIFDRYCELAQETDVAVTNFGTPEFWDFYYDDAFENRDHGILQENDETNQMGGQIDIDHQPNNVVKDIEKDIDNYLDIGKEYHIQVKRLKTEGVAFDVSFKNLDQNKNIE